MIIDVTRKIVERNSAKAFVFSFVTVLLISLIKFKFQSTFDHANYLLYYPVSFFLAWSIGFYPALLFIITSVILSSIVFSLQVTDVIVLARIAVYFFSSSTLAYLISKSVELVIQERDEKRHAFEDLKNKSIELLDFYDNAPIGFHVVDLNGMIVYINKAECNWIGYSPDELIGYHISKILTQDYINLANERLRSLEECKKFENVELSLLTKNGEKVHCIVNTLGVFNTEGKLTHARASLVNITEKIKEENHLRLLSLAVDQSPLSIEVTNSKIELEYVNEQFLKNCGYTWDEIKGKNPKVLSSGLTPRSTIEEMWLKLRDGLPWVGELTNKRKNGEVYTEKVFIAPVYDKNKELINYIALKDDITLKKRQESLIEEQRKKLIKSDQIFNNITKNIPGVIYIFKKNVDSSMNFVYASEGIYDFLGETFENLQKDASISFSHTHPEDLENLVNSINYSEEHLQQWNCEFRVNHPIRGLIWIAGQSTPERLQDGSTVWYGNLMDISEKRKQDHLILNQQKVIFDTSRMMALGEMASSMAHEINNPLTVIYNKTKKLKKIAQINDDNVFRDLDKIESSTERISKIVKALKSISYDPYGKEEEDKMYSADQLISDLLDFSGEKLKNSKIKIEVNCPENLFIICQYKNVIQSLLNLMSNAIHAVKSADEKWIKIEVTNDSGMVNFKFIDSGNGIDPKLVDKIMQPFFTTKDIGEGLGLGLSVAFNVAHKHFGKLYVDLDAQHTTVVFSLPIHQLDVQAA